MTTNRHPKSAINKNGLNIKNLRLADYNPRIISDSRLALLGESLNDYGDLSGFVFNKKTKNLICGNQRLKAIKDFPTRISTKPCKDKHGTLEVGHIEVQLTNGCIRIPFRIVDWDIKKEKAANIAANAHGGKFDLDKLKNQLDELNVDKFNVDTLGLEDLIEKELAIAKPPTRFAGIDDDAIQSGLNQVCPKCQYRFKSVAGKKHRHS